MLFFEVCNRAMLDTLRHDVAKYPEACGAKTLRHGVAKCLEACGVKTLRHDVAKCPEVCRGQELYDTMS